LKFRWLLPEFIAHKQTDSNNDIAQPEVSQNQQDSSDEEILTHKQYTKTMQKQKEKRSAVNNSKVGSKRKQAVSDLGGGGRNKKS
jgi:hypothetical protein